MLKNSVSSAFIAMMQIAHSGEPQAAATNRERRLLLRSLAILCACMVLFAATLRLAHNHTAAEQESGRCQICSSIHTAAPTAAVPVQIVLHAAPERVVTSTPTNPIRVRVTTLSDRAPPAGLADSL